MGIVLRSLGKLERERQLPRHLVQLLLHLRPSLIPKGPSLSSSVLLGSLCLFLINGLMIGGPMGG